MRLRRTALRTRVAYNWIHDGESRRSAEQGHLPRQRLSASSSIIVIGRRCYLDGNDGMVLSMVWVVMYPEHSFQLPLLQHRHLQFIPETNSDPAYWNASTHHLTYKGINSLILTDAVAVLENPAAQRDFRPSRVPAAVDPAAARQHDPLEHHRMAGPTCRRVSAWPCASKRISSSSARTCRPRARDWRASTIATSAARPTARQQSVAARSNPAWRMGDRAGRN